jgi:hypothetical protein
MQSVHALATRLPRRCASRNDMVFVLVLFPISCCFSFLLRPQTLYRINQRSSNGLDTDEYRGNYG